MINNLTIRMLTSIALSVLLLICLFFSKYTWIFLIAIASFISFFEFSKLINKIYKKARLKKIFSKTVFFIYILLFIYSCNLLYNFGPDLTLLILLICVFSDIGGYIIGKSIGGKKLTKISPNKTVSGSVGSFIFSIFPIFFFYFYNDIVYSININLVLLSLLTSFICQSGDILISYFKRKSKVKDTGSILPGHGGMLDRIDGIIFGVPFGLILLLLS